MATKSTRNLPYNERTSISDDDLEDLKRIWPGYDFTSLRRISDNHVQAIAKPKKDEAIKFDDGKIDWNLVPFEALEGMVQVLQFGAKKYAAWNWTEGGGFKWTRLFGSCARHLFAWARGEDNDPESGLSHIYHAQCNLLFLAYYIRNKEKFNKDDRNVR